MEDIRDDIRDIRQRRLRRDIKALFYLAAVTLALAAAVAHFV